MRDVVNLLAQASAVALTGWYVWIMLPPAVRITIVAELHRARVPFLAARERKTAAHDLWLDVIHLQTFGIPERWKASLA